jgi:DNA-binding transcriptional LysR family regulator
VATLPESFVDRYGQTFAIRKLAPSAPRVTIEVKLAWHERTEHDPLMRVFRGLVASAIQSSRA